MKLLEICNRAWKSEILHLSLLDGKFMPVIRIKFDLIEQYCTLIRGIGRNQ